MQYSTAGIARYRDTWPVALHPDKNSEMSLFAHVRRMPNANVLSVVCWAQ